jgi:glutamate-5-semialdehyde dehydrogenase
MEIEMNLKEELIQIAAKSRAAARQLAKLSSTTKNQILKDTAEMLLARQDEIIKINQGDVVKAKEKNLSSAKIDRLTLTSQRIKGMADGLMDVINLPDPVGEVIKMWKRPNGLMVGRMRVPIGVIGFIYESRPNVTIDAASLCLKSGNAIILRGGSETFDSNQILVDILQKALQKNNVTGDAVQYVPVTDRQAVTELVKLDEYIDLIIPRGAEALIRTVVENSTIPVIKHYKGVCSVYIEADADPEMAKSITINAKVQRPGVCNAIENLLVNQEIAETLMPEILAELAKAGVEIRGDEAVCRIYPSAKPATEEDWSTEYVDKILSVKVVKDIEEAISFIAKYDSKHSETIVTKDYFKAQKFIREVDSSAVFVNASTRFNDGFELGLGAEIGISTDKLHARGPMGLEELTCLKFIVYGEGQIRG